MKKKIASVFAVIGMILLVVIGILAGSYLESRKHKEPEISISSITRTRKKSVTGVLEGVKHHFRINNIDPSTYDFTTGTSDTTKEGIDECADLRRRLEEELGVVCVESRERFDSRVSMITGCHTGSYTMGIGYIPKYETLLPLVAK